MEVLGGFEPPQPHLQIGAQSMCLLSVVVRWWPQQRYPLVSTASLVDSPVTKSTFPPTAFQIIMPQNGKPYFSLIVVVVAKRHL